MRPVKILFVDHEAVLGGAELSMVNLVAELGKESVKIAAAIAGKGELADALKQAGVTEVYYLPMDGWRFWETGFVGRLKLLLSLPLFVRNIFLWYRLFKRTEPDIVHFNLTRLVEPVLAAKIAGARSIMHFRELSVQNKNFAGGLSLLYKLLRLADYWVANSTAMAEDIRRYAKDKKVFEVHNGIDVDGYSNGPGENKYPQIPKGKLIVAKIAGLVEWKNHKDFLNIAQTICQRRADVVFLIVGRGSAEYERQLAEYTRELGITEHVIFTGFVNDIPALLSQIDIVVHTATNESFGRIYIEAMAAAKPLVVFRGPATKEIIEEGVTGFVIDRADKNAMADKIKYLLDNDMVRMEMGTAGRKRVTELFSIKQTAHKMNHVYQYILSDGQA